MNTGGQYVPETLMPAIIELKKHKEAKADPEFQRELEYYLSEYVARRHLHMLHHILKA